MTQTLRASIIEEELKKHGIDATNEELEKLAEFSTDFTESLNEIRVFKSFEEYMLWKYDTKQALYQLLTELIDISKDSNNLPDVKEYLSDDCVTTLKHKYDTYYIYFFE